MGKDYWIKWLRAAGNRALRTVAQTAIAAIGTAAVLSEMDPKYIISAAIAAGIISLLTSLTGIPEIDVDEAEEG